MTAIGDTGWWRREYAIRLSARRCVLAVALAAALALTVAGALYLLRAPILTWMGQLLVDEDALEAADAIVVLAGGTPARELEAASLFQAGLAPRVIVPRGPDDGPLSLVTARGMQVELPYAFRLRILREFGVPDAALVPLTPVVGSTIEEAGSVVDWASGHDIHSLIVVTSAFHTARARFAYGRVAKGRDIRVTMRAARVGDAFRPEGWWETRAGLLTGLLELQKYMLYRLRY